MESHGCANDGDEDEAAEDAMKYSHRTVRFSQFWHGWRELQAFFWRTQRSQERRRLEVMSEVPSHVCRWCFSTSVRWKDALQTIHRCGRSEVCELRWRCRCSRLLYPLKQTGHR